MSNDRIKWFICAVAAAATCMMVGKASAAETSGASVTVSLIVLDAPSPTDQVAALPPSQTSLPFASTFFVEVWAQTPNPNGFAQISVDIPFDPSFISAVGIVHTALFDLFPGGTIDNVSGLLDDITGSHPPVSPPCSDSVGAAPNWARLAIIEMQAAGSGVASFVPTATGNPIFVISECGAFALPPVVFNGATVTFGEPPAVVELVLRGTPSSVDVADPLPSSQNIFSVGDSVFVELWAQAGSSNGFSQVTADVSFDPSMLSAVGVTHTALFNLFANESIDNTAGLIDNLSGSHPIVSPPCSDQVGFMPKWVRVAVVEMHADAPGDSFVRSTDSGDPIFIVAYCGAFNTPPVTHNDASLRIVPRVPAPEPVIVGKNRYLSFVPGNGGLSTALRLTLVDMPLPFDVHNGVTLWVGQPRDVSENGGVILPTAGFPNMTWAALVCDPVFMDWGSLGVLNISDRLIVPNGKYALQAIAAGADRLDETNFSQPLMLDTTVVWGDVVKDCSTIPCGPPDGSVDVITDTISVLNKFKNVANAIGKARADLNPESPDQIIDILDVVLTLNAFRGDPFPFPAGPRPCSP